MSTCVNAMVDTTAEISQYMVYCWPDWLPVPERSSYSYAVTDSRYTAEMDEGTFVSIQDDCDETTFSCQIKLESCAASMFDSFEQFMLNMGQNWFYMPLWQNSTISNFLCQFVGRPSVTQVKGYLTYVSFQVRVANRSITPKATYGLSSGMGREVLISWPSTLPVLQDQYSIELRDTTLKSSVGLATIKRSDIYADDVTIECKMSLSMQQIGAFEWLERNVLNQGARWFRMPLWVSGVLQQCIVRFKDRPKFDLKGFWTDVTFTLLLENRNLLDRLLTVWGMYFDLSALPDFNKTMTDLISGFKNLQGWEQCYVIPSGNTVTEAIAYPDKNYLYDYIIFMGSSSYGHNLCCGTICEESIEPYAVFMLSELRVRTTLSPLKVGLQLGFSCSVGSYGVSMPSKYVNLGYGGDGDVDSDVRTLGSSNQFGDCMDTGCLASTKYWLNTDGSKHILWYVNFSVVNTGIFRTGQRTTLSSIFHAGNQPLGYSFGFPITIYKNGRGCTLSSNKDNNGYILLYKNTNFCFWWRFSGEEGYGDWHAFRVNVSGTGVVTMSQQL